MDTQPIIQQFRKLDPRAKLHLLEQLWEEVAADPDRIPLTDEQRELLDERLRQHEENPEDVVDWEDVKKEAKERTRRIQ